MKVSNGSLIVSVLISLVFFSGCSKSVTSNRGKQETAIPSTLPPTGVVDIPLAPKITSLQSRSPNSGGDMLFIDIEGENFDQKNLQVELSREGDSAIQLIVDVLSKDVLRAFIPIASTLFAGDYLLTVKTAYGADSLVVTTLQGDRGETGPQGIQGVAGVQGIQGLKGDKGDTGAQGPQGAIGIQGPQGLKGEKGEKGETGNTGPQGLKGEVGPQGVAGIQGPQGVVGPQGPKGDAGDKKWVTVAETVQAKCEHQICQPGAIDKIVYIKSLQECEFRFSHGGAVVEKYKPYERYFSSDLMILGIGTQVLGSVKTVHSEVIEVRAQMLKDATKGYYAHSIFFNLEKKNSYSALDKKYPYSLKDTYKIKLQAFCPDL